MSNKTQAKQLPSKRNGQKNRKTASPTLGPGAAISVPRASSGNSTAHATTEAKLSTAQAQRKMASQEAAMRRERQQSVRTLGALIAVFVVVGVGAFAFYIREVFKPPPLPPPGEEVPIMQSYHLKSGDEAHPAYTTDPPTSGPHIGSLPDWGVHTEPITKELAIHVLEDAGININYQPSLDKATVDRLAALTTSYSDLVTQDSEDNHVVMAPYPGLSDPIVLTAWRHIYRLKDFDEAGIRAFIDAYKNIDHHVESGDRPANAGTPGTSP